MRLVTPEAVVLEFDTAGIGSRMVALLLDVLLQLAVLLFLLLVFSSAGLGDVVSGNAGTAVAVFFYFAIFSTRMLYPAISEAAWRGRTLGKAAMGLRVVTTDGAPVRFRHTIVRAALSLVDFELTGGAGAFFSALFTRRNQRLGDLAAGTLVVRERTGAVTPTAAWFAVPPGCEGYVATLDVGGLSVADYSAVRAFLLRAHTLAPGPRARLAVQLASPLADRTRHRPPEWVGPELFLACLAAAWQQRAGPTGSAGPPGVAGVPPAAAPPPGREDDDPSPAGGAFAPPT